jgi:ABC-2 type transport system ATP-binding protein
VIHVEELSRDYRVPKKEPGLRGSLRSLFSRRYDTIHAVDRISLRIAPGERVGFLGPNGAGKTTALKMMAGLLVPSAGRVQVAGFRPTERAPEFLRRITLVMGQKMQLLWDLPPRETFELNGAVFGLPKEQVRRTQDELVELLDLGKLMDRPVRNLSLGERMKCELAAALLHRPDVLFLDEPTLGLDVSMQAAVRQFVGDWNRRSGATVLLTSHYMADIEALCPRVVVIAQGRLRYDGALRELVARYAPDRRVLVSTLRELEPAEKERLGPFAPDGDGGGLAALVPAAEVPQVVDHALRSFPVQDLRIEEPPLEDVIRRLFAEEAKRSTGSQVPVSVGESDGDETRP